ncbi:signal peptidase I [Pseudoalteromonas marina]|uniref:Signal peptidase I n=1 Tax=Pseudoalteromonas marina TaxID=267375 RepID=A0ABT9FGF8_9GAMM|nr:signal peptidase I [Pseudoalteromonas marina]MDP2565873.1 signal peptidase I [Pseudoalteromonas marina]
MSVKSLFAYTATLLLVLSLKSVVFDYHKVPSESMEPNIEVGGAVFVNKLAYGLRAPFSDTYLLRWGEPSPADIVILSSPVGGFNNWVKRIVGVQGSSFDIQDGNIFINGYQLECTDLYYSGDNKGLCLERLGPFSYIVNWESIGASKYPFESIVVPKDHVFVLGDNRNHTAVSSPVHIDTVLGEVLYVSLGKYTLYFTLIYSVFVFAVYFILLGFLNRIIRSK